jgi:hypothetical protein
VLRVVVANAADKDGNTVNVHFPGRRDDCASNDLSVGLLLEYGRFRYLIAGDLTGEPAEDDAPDLDVYHINHHGARTSSSADFMLAIKPTVVIVSNGRQFSHPSKTVVEDKILTLDLQPIVYLTNRTTEATAWNAPADQVADGDFEEFDGTVEIAVWRETFRVYRWRNGARIDGGDRYAIKPR